MHGELFLGGASSGVVSNARLKLSRTDSEGTLLGPMKATEFAVGDVVQPATPPGIVLGSGTWAGRSPISPSAARPNSTELPWTATSWRGGKSNCTATKSCSIIANRNPTAGTFSRTSPSCSGSIICAWCSMDHKDKPDRKSNRSGVGAGQVQPGQHHYRFSVNEQKKPLFQMSETGNTEQDGYGEKAPVRPV